MTLRAITACLLCVRLLAPSASALTIEAEQARIKTVGGMQRGAWNQWSPGEWGDIVAIENPGTYTVRVTCFGSPAENAWPEMAFGVDGAVQEIVTVDTPTARDYTFTLDADAGCFRLALWFLNDRLTDSEDRNLYIASMSVTAPDDAPPPTLCSETVWGRKKAAAEERILAQAADAIERNRKRDAELRVVDAAGRPAAGVKVEVELIRHAFRFGGNIFLFDQYGSDRYNAVYKQRFRELFNAATTGFYWKWYEPERGQPNYAYTDKVVDWCLRNDIRVKGHPLLWANPAGIPEWSDGQPAAALQEQRVTEIMQRYAGRIEAWEVVNEPSHLPGLAIDAPYRWARAADPAAHLIVNDFFVFANGAPHFHRLLEQAIRDGVPFDGIGIQAHEPTTMRFALDEVWRILDWYAELDKDLHITEFTPASGGQEISGSHVQGRWDEAAQADYVEKFYTVCFAHPAVVGITWWDLCNMGWVKGGGLLRKDLSPKPAYDALKDLIHNQWITNIAGSTDADGRFCFRGFHGEYTLRAGGREYTLDLAADGPNALPIRLE